jgi:hypothetical protein
MHQGTWQMSITHHSLLLRANITHKRAQLTRDAKGNKTIHCITHHDPYDNAIAIDECHFEASDHVSRLTTRVKAVKTKEGSPQRLSLVVLPYQDMVWCYLVFAGKV